MKKEREKNTEVEGEELLKLLEMQNCAYCTLRNKRLPYYKRRSFCVIVTAFSVFCAPLYLALPSFLRQEEVVMTLMIIFSDSFCIFEA